MPRYEVRYLNYEGNTATMTVEVADGEGQEEAASKALTENIGDGDGIHLILSVEEEIL